MKSIIQGDEKGICFLCQKTIPTEEHHIIHGTANRKISEELGLKVNLCWKCHRLLHDRGVGDKELKVEAQKSFEKTHSRDEWMKLFGRNYCDLADTLTR